MQINTRNGFPISAFEHYQLADSRSDYPMVFWLVLSFSGTTEAQRMQASLDKALLRHPLLSSHLSGHSGLRSRQIRWQHNPAAQVYLDLCSEGTALQFPVLKQGLTIDLSREIGVRAFVRQGPDSSRWFLQFHHSATDGTGAVRFVEDVLRFYAEPSAEVRALSLATASLCHRGSCGLSRWQILSSIPRYLDRAWRYFLKNPKGLSDLVSFGFTDSATELTPAYVQGEISRDELVSIKNRGREQKATVNDLLLRATFEAIDRWHHLRGQNGRPIRIVVPVSMRRVQDRNMPAANMMGMVFVDRRGAILRRPRELLDSIVTEMGSIKKHGLGFALNFAIGLVGRLRGGVVSAVMPRLLWKCAGTVVLSNLGEALAHSGLPRNQDGLVVAGNLTLTDLELLPPLRVQTNISIGVVTYGGRLRLSGYYDHTILSRDDARTLLRELRSAAIHESLSVPVPVSVPVGIEG